EGHQQAVPERGEHLHVVQELQVPGEGEALPRGREPPAVEGEGDQHQDRRVQEEVGEEGKTGEDALAAPRPLRPHNVCEARRGRRKVKSSASTRSDSRKESAEPKGMSRATANWLWIR